MPTPRWPSREMVEGPARAPARAMLRAAGYDEEALAKPLVAIVNSWSTVTPCNMHLRGLAEHARRGIEEAIRSRRPTLINAIIDEKAGTESGRITNLNPAAKKKT